MKKVTFTKLLTVNRPPIEVQDWPGYRTGLSNLPGINLVLAYRTAKSMGGIRSLNEWGMYDEASGFYLGVHAKTRLECAENAITMLALYTPESYAKIIEGRYLKRTTAILTGGMK